MTGIITSFASDYFPESYTHLSPESGSHLSPLPVRESPLRPLSQGRLKALPPATMYPRDCPTDSHVTHGRFSRTYLSRSTPSPTPKVAVMMGLQELFKLLDRLAAGHSVPSESLGFTLLSVVPNSGFRSCFDPWASFPPTHPSTCKTPYFQPLCSG